MIPYKSIHKKQLDDIGKGTLSELLGISVHNIGENHLTMKMEVKASLLQPIGLLHGGAVAALAENVASLAGNLVVNPSAHCVGLSLVTNHLKAAKEGFVYATATPVHLGKRTQVWRVETKNEADELINLATMTLAVINK